MTQSNGPVHHWVRVSDQDLALILDGPEGDEPTHADLWAWIDEVLDIVEDGLETA